MLFSFARFTSVEKLFPFFPQCFAVMHATVQKLAFFAQRFAFSLSTRCCHDWDSQTFVRFGFLCAHLWLVPQESCSSTRIS